MIDVLSRKETDRLLERKARLSAWLAARPQLAARLRVLRTWQAERLARTYADLRADPQGEGAVDFFLTDLYGPRDFTRRDAELRRAWGVLRRTLPPFMRAVLALAIELEVLSEELDLDVARHLPPGQITPESYARAYRAAGRPEARRRQIELTLEVGRRLARAVRMPLVGRALRAARTPARMAGFGLLQDFLERGFAAFARMPSAAPLLAAIRERETAFMSSLLAGTPGDPVAAADGGPATAVNQKLPGGRRRPR